MPRSRFVISIYVLLAIPLKSYFQPLAILVTLPFCFMGALFGHLLLGMPFGLMSLLGVIASLGVAVNDSLVFVHEYNHIKGKSFESESQSSSMLAMHLSKTGQARFKVVFLTSLCTFGGLIPLIFTDSVHGNLLARIFHK